MTVSVVAFEDSVLFEKAVRPLTDAEPTRCTFLTTGLDAALSGASRESSYWWLVEQEGQPVAAAGDLGWPAHLALTPLPEAERSLVARSLAREILKTGERPKGVMAAIADADAFATAWQPLAGAEIDPVAVYRLYEMVAPPGQTLVEGTVRLATPDDLSLVTRWFGDFMTELEVRVPGRREEIAETHMKACIATNGLHLWLRDGEPVSMAHVYPAAFRVSRISPVYTPPALRRQGFAAAATAAATRTAFIRGAVRCVLFADLSNPTSNGIYQDIGYRELGDSRLIGFRYPDAVRPSPGRTATRS